MKGIYDKIRKMEGKIMVKNTRISLKKDSQDRVDALNSIKYTLLLDYQVPEIDKDENWITTIMDACQNCCKGLFGFDKYSQIKIYNFFGEKDDLTDKPLAYMNELRDDSMADIDERGMGFHHMILQQCVMAAYHAILTELLAEKKATSYEIVNKIKHGEDDSLGIQYLNNKGIYSLKEGKFQINSASKKTNSKKSSTASDYKKKSDAHKTVFASYSIFGKAHEDIPMQFADVWNRICKKRPEVWQICNKVDDMEGYVCLGKIQELGEKVIRLKKRYSNEAARNFEDSCGDIVDGLYVRYLMERIFNFNTIYS